MFRPITGSAHPTARPVNREVFSLAWAEPSVYATGASQGWVQLHIIISITITFQFLVQLQLHS